MITTGNVVGWPEFRVGIEEAATGADGLLLDIPDERWCAGPRGIVPGQSGVVSPVLI